MKRFYCPPACLCYWPFKGVRSLEGNSNPVFVICQRAHFISAAFSSSA